jgi:hypothetical protein
MLSSSEKLNGLQGIIKVSGSFGPYINQIVWQQKRNSAKFSARGILLKRRRSYK